MSKTAFTQNGREVTWAQVTTEDLIATVANYPGTADAVLAQEELYRRTGSGRNPSQPAIQNIPVRTEAGAQIKEAFRKRKTSPIFGRCNEHEADDCFWCFPGM